MTPVLVLLFGLIVMYVSGCCLWAFVGELSTYKWSSDFALGASSVLMLLVGGVLTICGLLYTEWPL